MKALFDKSFMGYVGLGTFGYRDDFGWQRCMLMMMLIVIHIGLKPIIFRHSTFGTEDT